MNCVNCGSRLTFFNETDELLGGTERALCVSCRKKVTPFLEEPCAGTHIDHLRERKAALIARGVTVEGYAHLDDYCRYLDSLRPKQAVPVPGADPVAQPEEKRVSTLTAIRRSMQEETDGERAAAARTGQVLLDAQLRSNQLVQKGVEELSVSLSDNTRILSDKLERAQDRIRLLTYLAASGAGTGVLSFLAVLLLLILR